MNILFISGFSNFGGATKSLLTMLKTLNKINNNICFFILTTNKLKMFFENYGYIVKSLKWLSMFDITKYGFYKKVRWLLLFREIFFLPQSLIAIYTIIKKNKIDIVHLNDVTFFMYAWFAKKIIKDIKVVMHVRAVLCEKKCLRIKFFEFIVNNYVDSIIAIDETVKDSIPNSLLHKVSVIHNSFEIKSQIQKNECNDTFTVGFIGVLYPAKGIYELMESAKILLKDLKLNNIRFLVAGENTRDIKNYLLKKILCSLKFYKDTKNDLLNFINTNKLNKNIVYLGFIKDVDFFYSSIDVLVFPSYLNAIGRPVFEAGFYGVPSIASINNPKSDTIIHMETGICISCPPNPKEIAEAILLLYKDRELLKKLSIGANKLSNTYFNTFNNGIKIYNLYNELLN